MTTLGLGLSGANRVGSQFNLLSGVSSDFALYTPEAVLMNFIEMLKRSNPMLRYGLTIAVPVVIVGAALSQFELAVWAFKTVKNCLYARVTTRIRIGPDHDLQKQLMIWLAKDKLKDTHLLALADSREFSSPSYPTSYPSTEPPFDYDDLDDYVEPAPTAPAISEHEDTNKLVFVPDVGQHDFTFEGYRMRFVKNIETYHDPSTGKPHEYEVVYVWCLSIFAGARLLRRFLDHVKKETTVTYEAMTWIHRPQFIESMGRGRNDVRWDNGVMRPSRKLDAVVLDKCIKDPLLEDIQDYLNPRTRRFYIDNGIPYRKGYLMYGPPGTGKTTFAAALAGEYNLDVYMVSLSHEELSDQYLETLFESLPIRCIVLIEDIDSAGIKRETMTNKVAPKIPQPTAILPPVLGGNAPTPGPNNSDWWDGRIMPLPKKVVTLSGLLNVLDGVRAAEGRILLMTSNNPDALDKALVRAGRIDKKVLFGYASHEVAIKMFTRIFTKSAEQMLNGETQFENVSQLAEEFAALIPDNAMSPALIQCHLLSHRTDPAAAVSTTPTLVAEAMEEKRSGTNVAGFEAGLDLPPKT
ncbi:hypothetical protein LTR56_000400 [Elasticomyces elasticus]|nr:hypothetical protein LTR56_000400 [Elasticomyces elasticus]KAK3666905.1 hypothetical protein LTR22_002130 [Elasticomyces elasticus]KAK4933393.1 hypothetical protein LTR49_000387 [Elasticomyces elasticus]KAK5755515.1 hypothetical protein LTS12_014383 [Elasticomyces elasticus]